MTQAKAYKITARGHESKPDILNEEFDDLPGYLNEYPIRTVAYQRAVSAADIERSLQAMLNCIGASRRDKAQP